MKASELKEKLRRALTRVEQLNDEDEVKVASNTYFLGDCRLFLGISSEGYINLDKLDVEKAEVIELEDVELCIELDDDNSLGLMTFDELHKICIKHCVVVEVAKADSESGWPHFNFKGLEKNIEKALEEIGVDQYTIDKLMEEAEC